MTTKQIFISIYFITLLMIFAVKIMEIRKSSRQLTRFGRFVLRVRYLDGLPFTRRKRTMKSRTMKETVQNADDRKSKYLQDGWRPVDNLSVSQNRKSEINQKRFQSNDK